MKKSNLIILIVALCMLFSGVFVCIGAFSMEGMSYENMFTDNSTLRTETYDEAFYSVDARAKAGNLEIFPTSEDELRIECTEPENTYYDIKFEGDILVIELVDNRQWHDYLMNFDREGVKIYLPQRVYNDIKLDVSSGKITVNEGLECRNLMAETSSGSVRAYNVKAQENVSLKAASGSIGVDTVTADNMEVLCTSGKITVSNLELTGNLDIDSSSGKIEAINVNCNSFNSQNESGGIICSDVICKDSLNADTSSGKIEVLRSDAQNLDLNTTSGSIRGTLLSEKVFVAHSTSGSVRVPDTTQGGVCKAKATSGSIKIEIVE